MRVFTITTHLISEILLMVGTKNGHALRRSRLQGEPPRNVTGIFQRCRRNVSPLDGCMVAGGFQ